MAIQCKQNCRWSLVVPTSMGIRITPADRQSVHTSKLFTMQATSAESNVASIPASLGLPVKVLTAFVKDNPISRFIQSDLRSRGIAYEGPEIDAGGPWGYRHQFNIADSGYGPRGPRVTNDRAGEVGRLLRLDDFDIPRIFSAEGAAAVHLSGLIAALSPETGAFCLEIARAAKKYGSVISFDLNYRASFWKGREDSLRDIFSQIASLSDILIGNEEDFQLALGIPGPETGGKDLSAKIQGFQEMIRRVRTAYPNASAFATTLRQVLSANRHLWGALLLSGDEWQIVEPREIEVYDRIGGGDGFVGGLLYALLKGWDAEKWVCFGWATGALAASVATDYALPLDEEQVWSIYAGNARVKR